MPISLNTNALHIKHDGVYDSLALLRYADNVELRTQLMSSCEEQTLTWNEGGINGETGMTTTSAKRIRSDRIIGSCDYLLIRLPSTMMAAVYGYTTDLGAVNYEGRLAEFTAPDGNGEVAVRITAGLSYFIVLKFADESNIATTDAASVSAYRCNWPHREHEDNLRSNFFCGKADWPGMSFTWEGGTIDGDTGADHTSAYVIRTRSIPLSADLSIRFSGAQADGSNIDRISYVYFYDAEGTYIGRSPIISGTAVISPGGTASVRFIYGYATSSGVSAAGKGYSIASDFSVVVEDNSFKRYLDAIGYLRFNVVKGYIGPSGAIHRNSVAICTKDLFHLKVGSVITVKIWGNWVYSVMQGDSPVSLTKTQRLVNYSEIEVVAPYVGFMFYKTDGEGNTINAQPEDLGNSVILFDSGDTSKAEAEIHDMPENIGVLNVINRAYQMAKLYYEPVANLPTQVDFVYGGVTYNKYIPQGTPVRGVMYSSVRNEGAYVPQCVSLQTYMTALANPNSYIYTKTETGHANAKTYYGAVCSSMVGWCYGIDTVIPTTVSFDTLDGMEQIENQSPYGLKLGDMVCKSDNHIAIVTDIMRTSRGIIKYIELCDQINTSSHPMTRRRQLSPGQVQSVYFDSGYIAYRYHWIYAVPYTPSPWVTLDEETAEPSVNANLAPRRGESANWRPGEDIEIDVTPEDYTQATLMKGETLVSTISIPAGNVLTYSNLTYGDYSVFLTDGVNNSDPVYFSIIDSSISASALYRTVTVTFSSQNATPSSISLCDGDSNSSDYRGGRVFHVLTDAEIAAGHAQIEAPAAGNWLAKAMFKTPFGLYSSDFASVTLS